MANIIAWIPLSEYKKLPRIWICPICSKKSYNSYRFKQHLKNHNDERPYKCDICSKSFKDSYYYHKIHRKMHEGVKPKLECDFCDIKLSTAKTLRIHRNKHLNEFYCSICKKSFGSQSDLQTHVGVSHENISYQCEICGKMLKSVKNLVLHKEIHMSDRPTYKCGKCEKTFKVKTVFAKHCKTHDDYNTQLVCDICGKVLGSRGSLNDHIAMHKGIKAFECKVCNRKFTRMNTMKLHMNVHSGARPYKCKLCDKAFTQSTPLKMHMRTHTGEKPYECEVCHKRLISKSVLNAHKKHNHKVLT